MRLLKTIEKIIQEAEEQYNSSVDKGLSLDELDRLEENYRKSLKLMDMLETKNKRK
jgi:methionine aminopeptidase